MTQDIEQTPPDTTTPAPPPSKRVIWVRILGCAMIVAAFAARPLFYPYYGWPTALFIWLPSILAVGFVFASPARTRQASMALFVTFALVMSGVVIPEGTICIIMAAPFFYGIGAIAAVMIDVIAELSDRGWTAVKEKRGTKLMVVAVLPALMATSFEGISEDFSFARDETVTVTKTVPLTTADIEAALTNMDRIGYALPKYLRMGFPRPVRMEGSPLAVGAVRAVDWSNGARTELKITARTSDSVTVTVTKQTRVMATWLTWRTVTASWRPIDAGRSEVTWTIRYRRLLDPAWYFGPWERYAVTLVAGVLIDDLTMHAQSNDRR